MEWAIVLVIAVLLYLSKPNDGTAENKQLKAQLKAQEIKLNEWQELLNDQQEAITELKAKNEILVKMVPSETPPPEPRPRPKPIKPRPRLSKEEAQATIRNQLKGGRK